MTYRRLLLFDIDGTLLTTNGDAVTAMLAAVEAVYGQRPPSDGFLMDGKTELRIVHELLASVGVGREAVESGLPRLWQHYSEGLRRHLSAGRVTVYPGVRDLLAHVRGRPDLLLGLLTGNIEPAARAKLHAAGLGEFSLGAFGSHHEAREALPALAVDEAARRFGQRFAGKDIVILGDTPNDVRCGSALGVTSIAVATGHYSREALAAEMPDHLFDDFSDLPAVMAAIDGPGGASLPRRPGSAAEPG